MNSKIIIVGGGSAGWMTASSMVKIFPNKEITLVESPEVATIGVGESTTQYMREWVDFIGLKDEEWMPACDATYKFGLKFVNFAESDFFYPFGLREEDVCNLSEYFRFSNQHHTSNSDFGRVFYPQQPAMEQNRIPHQCIPSDSGFHFDALKFASYLRDNYAKPRGVRHIQDHVIDIIADDTGIRSLSLKDHESLAGDIYFDCTGFSALLIDKTLKTPWIDFSSKLFNNRTWAVQIPYRDKESQFVNYTTCTALSSGWVWNVPTWSRMGTGYNYCDRYISPDEALREFRTYLGINDSNLKFRDLQWPTGIRDKVWNKNVVAIGLSGGFIEPLESGGLYSVHEFLNAFFDVAENHDRWDGLARDSFNYKCKSVFSQFADFVELHYTMSRRDDTDYWRAYTGKHNPLENNNLLLQLFEFQHHSPYNLDYSNTMNLALSMLIGGFKYPIRNQRKEIYFQNRYPVEDLPRQIVDNIKDKISAAYRPKTQWLKNLEYYAETIYKKS